MQLALEYFVWFIQDGMLTFLGALWSGLLGAFLMFLYNYFYYYHMAYRRGNMEYMIAYKDLDRHARRIVVAFIMFICITVSICVIDFEAFCDVIIKGLLVNLIIIPALCWHYGDEKKYKFKNM